MGAHRLYRNFYNGRRELPPDPRLVVAIFSLATLLAAQTIKSIEGQWAGTLQNSGGDTLPLTLSIARTTNGELTGTLDSPKDGLYGLPLARSQPDWGASGGGRRHPVLRRLGGKLPTQKIAPDDCITIPPCLSHAAGCSLPLPLCPSWRSPPRRPSRSSSRAVIRATPNAAAPGRSRATPTSAMRWSCCT